MTRGQKSLIWIAGVVVLSSCAVTAWAMDNAQSSDSITYGTYATAASVVVFGLLCFLANSIMRDVKKHNSLLLQLIIYHNEDHPDKKIKVGDE